MHRGYRSVSYLVFLQKLLLFSSVSSEVTITVLLLPDSSCVYINVCLESDWPHRYTEKVD